MDQAGFTTRCTWCGKIKNGDNWHHERRSRPLSYIDTICPNCEPRDFPQPEKQIHQRNHSDRVLAILRKNPGLIE
jgi:hypothetical protein